MKMVVYYSSASNYPGKSVGLNRGQDSAKNNEVGNLHDWYDNIITLYIYLIMIILYSNM